jgi:hypothetical protein
MMADPDRGRVLEAFGYTARQAQFLGLVIRHGGYFLRRQYVAFTGTSHGQAAVRFLRAALTRGDIRALPGGRAGHVFHVCARPLYAAVGDAHHRSRPTEWDAVIRTLMTVDFALAHGEAQFWTTEADKAELLRDLQIPEVLWPARTYLPHRERARPTTRYFLDKMPWLRTETDPRLWFAYIDADSTRRGFDTFLVQYRALWSALPSGVIYVAPTAWRGPVEALFQKRLVVARLSVADLARVGEYFHLRREIEANRLAGLSVAQLDAFRELRGRYAIPAVEALYARWRQHPAASPTSLAVDHTSRADCVLRVYALGHRYDARRAHSGSTPQHGEVT